ncbi:hypothetical protein RJT34_19272 [Clitoria ternatea]|uniref:NYN domain-containing protein n=1 Tax=Clitoria ternatea TaxID=43366 RepID=A0AAN9P459_CLITE
MDRITLIGDSRVTSVVNIFSYLMYALKQIDLLEAKISVWWDIENCGVPKGYNPHSIAQNIASALAHSDHSGPVSISAYGDTNRIPFHIQHALSSTGIALNHVPAGAKDASDKKILVDMLLWAIDNPAPATYLLISGDRDFSNALHQLSMRKYTILLAQPPQASAPLVAAAKVVWLWTTLCSGGPPNHVVDAGKLNLPPIPSQHKSTNVSRTPTSPVRLPKNDDNIAAPTNSVFKAPHEFFSTAEPKTATITPNLPRNQYSSTSGDGISISRDSYRPKQPMFPVTRSTRFQPAAFPNLIGDVNMSNVYQHTDKFVNTIPPNERQFFPAPPPSDSVQVDVILRTLNVLKIEKVLSTEGNITDCIRYGDPWYQTIDVRMALNFAVERQMIERRMLGALHVYVGKNEKLWDFVNHIGGVPSELSRTTLDRIHNFLASLSGRSMILASRCRYEASLNMRRSCLAELGLGDVLRILEMLITVMRWIIPHHSGWQPITIAIKETRGPFVGRRWATSAWQGSRCNLYSLQSC